MTWQPAVLINLDCALDMMRMWTRMKTKTKTKTNTKTKTMTMTIIKTFGEHPQLATPETFDL